MKNYIDESVLSKLPTGYQSNLKQSNASEQDDMGNYISQVVIADMSSILSL